MQQQYLYEWVLDLCLRAFYELKKKPYMDAFQVLCLIGDSPNFKRLEESDAPVVQA